MKKFSRIVSFLLIAAVTLTMAACTSTEPSTSSNSSSGTSTPTSSADGEDIELTFTYWGSPVEKQVIEASMKKFEEAHPGVKVTPMHIPEDYDTKITTMMAANELPDLGYMTSLAFLWAEEGKIINVFDKLENDPDIKKEDFLDTVWYTWAPGKSMGPMPASEPFALFYNEDLLKEAGVETPPDNADDAWTWDEFIEVCKKLTIDINGNDATNPNFDPQNIQQYGVQFPIDDQNVFDVMANSNGGAYFDEEGNYQLNQPEAVEAIQALADLINVHHVAPSPVVSKSLPSAAIALQTGKTAMSINGQWICLDLGETEGLNFNIGVLPKMKESLTVVQGGVICMFEGSEHPDEAWELWKWLYDPESVLELHSSGLWSPVLKEWYTDPDLLAKWAIDNPAHPSGYMGAFIDQPLQNGYTGPALYVKNFSKVNTVVMSALDEVWLGNKTAQEVLDSIDSQVQDKMAE